MAYQLGILELDYYFYKWIFGQDSKGRTYFVFGEYENDEEVEEWEGRISTIKKMVSKKVDKVIKNGEAEIFAVKQSIRERFD